ncbi:MAG: hypothetical protein PHS97_05970 [Oscillospiraceae bacterium]|nr:hypothetical protein [Oscillospiraceae bacterium]
MVCRIALRLNGALVQPRGVLNISFRIPQGFDAGKTQLYFVSPTGEKTLLAGSVANGILAAKLDHLSLYVLVQPKTGGSGSSSSGSTSGSQSGSSSGSSSDTSTGTSTGASSAGGASSGTTSPGMPQTGDAFPLVWVLIAAAACTAVLALLVWKKHRETQA